MLILSCSNVTHKHHSKSNSGTQENSNTFSVSSGETVDISIDDTKALSFDPQFYSVSTASMYAYFNVDDAQFISEVNKMQFNNVQFPGGSLSHWNHLVINGKGNGYNIDSKEVQSHGNDISSLAGDESSKNGQDYFEETIKFCKSTSTGLILVANIMTGSQAELEYALTRCQKENIPVKVAMGVELHIKDQRDDFPTAQSYKTKVQSYIDLVRKKFPGTLIAADACPVDETKNDFSFFDGWNKLVATMDFDAFGIYQWAYVADAEMDGDLDGTFKKGNQMLTDFVNKEAPDQLVKYKAYFGNKPLWIMQCGVNFRNNGIFGNTITSAMHLADYFLWCTEYNATHNNYLQVVCYQKLGSTNVTCDVLTPYKGAKDKMIPQVDIVERSPFYAFSLIGNVFSGDKKFCSSIVSSNTSKDITGSIKVYSFVDSNNKHYLFVINKGVGFNIGKLLVNNKAITGSATVSEVWGSSLYSTNGYSNWMKIFPGGTASQIQNDVRTTEVSKIQIQNYSITRIEF